MKLIKYLWTSLTQLSVEENEPTIIIYTNKQIIIEQVKELLSFTNNQITLQHEIGVIEINGENLSIRFMHQDELALLGAIHRVEFLHEKGEG